MTTYEKTLRLARLIGLDYHASNAKQRVWRQVKRTRFRTRRGHGWVPWRPYECLEDMGVIARWVVRQHPGWLEATQPATSIAFCDAVLAAFAPEPEPTTQSEVVAALVTSQLSEEDKAAILRVSKPEPTALAEYHASIAAERIECRGRAERAEAELAEGDYWMERSKKFAENGGCPVCFASDESGHTDGCMLGKAEDELAQCEVAICGLADVIGDMECERDCLHKLLSTCVDSARDERATQARPCIPWRHCSEHGDTFEDGEQMMVAVPVRDCRTGKCSWEVEAIVANVDDEDATCSLDSLYGDDWGWDWCDVEWWLPMSEVLATLPAVEAADAAERGG